MKPFVFKMPDMGQLWKHYKGGVYVIIRMALDANTGRPVVLYSLQGELYLFTRDLGDFLGYTDNHEQRFVLLQE